VQESWHVHTGDDCREAGWVKGSGGTSEHAGMQAYAPMLANVEKVGLHNSGYKSHPFRWYFPFNLAGSVGSSMQRRLAEMLGPLLAVGSGRSASSSKANTPGATTPRTGSIMDSSPTGLSTQQHHQHAAAMAGAALSQPVTPTRHAPVSAPYLHPGTPAHTSHHGESSPMTQSGTSTPRAGLTSQASSRMDISDGSRCVHHWGDVAHCHAACVPTGVHQHGSAATESPFTSMA
jgi:hypothetical protein